MPRSSPPDALVRHLLRHMMDLRELMRNELAVSFLQTIPAGDAIFVRQNKIIEWIRRSVELLARGQGRKGWLQAEIVRRCDLSGESHAEVWAALGLSRRAFYYKRRAALVELAILLTVAIPTAVPEVRCERDSFELRLAAAHALRCGGQFEAAERRCDDLVRCSQAAEQRVRARAAGLESQSVSGAVERVRRTLSVLEQDVSHLDSQSNEGVVSAVIGATACASARWRLGEAGAALEDFHVAERLVTLHPQLLEDRRVAGAWVQSLLQVAEFQAIAGRATEALSATREASALVAQWHDAEPEIRSQLLVSRAMVLLTLDRPLAEAETSAHAALSIARQHDLRNPEVEAACALCLVQAVSGNRLAALQTGHAALGIADRFHLHPIGTFLRFILARIEAYNSNMQASQALLREGTHVIATDGVLAIFRDSAAASVALASGAFSVALQRSREAAAGAQRSGFDRITGSALVLQAHALASLGRSRAAASVVDVGVAMLEKGGARYTLADAYALSGRLTGNLRRQQQARELRAILMKRPA